MFEKEVMRIAQRISFGADVSNENPLWVAAAQVLLKNYVPIERPTKVYVGPHVPGYGLNYW
jgi:hypothetical protein